VSSGDGYRLAGQVFFHPLAVRIASSAPDAALLQAYIRQNAEAGSLMTYEVSTSGVVVVGEEPMLPTSVDSARFDALFSPDARTEAERGFCDNSLNRLSWSPY